MTLMINRKAKIKQVSFSLLFLECILEIVLVTSWDTSISHSVCNV